jgi:hypothetical protein
LAQACISTDHPRYLAYIPSAPSEYASLFDLVVGASALYTADHGKKVLALSLQKIKHSVGSLI